MENIQADATARTTGKRSTAIGLVCYQVAAKFQAIERPLQVMTFWVP